MPDSPTESTVTPRSVQAMENFHAAVIRSEPFSYPITTPFVQKINNGDTIVKGNDGQTLTADFQNLESIAQRFATESDIVRVKAVTAGVKIGEQMGVPLDVLTPIMALDHVLRALEGDTSTSDLSQRNIEMYHQQKQRNLSDFFQEGNPTFTCTEESMLGQFLLQTYDTGMQVTMVTRGLIDMTGRDLGEISFDQNTQAHVFLLLHKSDNNGQYQEGYLYDPTNPLVFADPNNAGKTISYPAVQRLEKQQFTAITKGSGLTIELQDNPNFRRTYATV